MISIKECKSLFVAQQPKTKHHALVGKDVALTHYREAEAPRSAVLEYYFAPRILPLSLP